LCCFVERDVIPAHGRGRGPCSTWARDYEELGRGAGSGAFGRDVGSTAEPPPRFRWEKKFSSPRGGHHTARPSRAEGIAGRSPRGRARAQDGNRRRKRQPCAAHRRGVFWTVDSSSYLDQTPSSTLLARTRERASRTVRGSDLADSESPGATSNLRLRQRPPPQTTRRLAAIPAAFNRRQPSTDSGATSLTGTASTRPALSRAPPAPREGNPVVLIPRRRPQSFGRRGQRRPTITCRREPATYIPPAATREGIGPR